MIRRQFRRADTGPYWAYTPPSRPQSVPAQAHAMPLSIMPTVMLGAPSAKARGAARRPEREKSHNAAPAHADDPFLEAPEDEEDGDQSSASSLSILAHALQAYSQN